MATAKLSSDSVNVRLSERDAVLLDQLRGRATRATFMRSLLRAEGGRRKRGSSTAPPTHEESLRLLRDHAETDPGAAIELQRTLASTEQLARLRAIADPLDDG